MEIRINWCLPFWPCPCVFKNTSLNLIFERCICSYQEKNNVKRAKETWDVKKSRVIDTLWNCFFAGFCFVAAVLWKHEDHGFTSWPHSHHRASQVMLVVKSLPVNAGDASLIPGWGRCPGEGNGNPLQYYCLENPMDRGVWQATVLLLLQLLLSHFSCVRLCSTP